MKKLLLCILVSVSLIACTNQEIKTTNGDDANIATFKENSKIVEASMNAFTKNDPKAWDSYFADSAKFHSADYGKDAPDSALNLSASRLRLAGFHTIVKNINAKFEYLVPGIDPETYKPNGLEVRMYGTMSGESISNGTKISHKIYQIYTFNKDHKIVDIDEYFDVTGAVLVATAPKK
jgi:hypothetical protein